MLTRVTVLDDYVHVAAGCTDVDGGAADPTWAEVRFYRMSPTTGELAAATEFGDDGVVSLVKQGGQTGFYGSTVSLSGVELGQFVLLFRALIGGTCGISVDYLRLEADGRERRCVANAVYSSESDVLTVNAWLTCEGICVDDALQCTFELYDDAGALVFDGLSSNEPDGRGVFRLTRSEPGLAADKSYYGKVSIFDGNGIFFSLVGLVTVE